MLEVYKRERSSTLLKQVQLHTARSTKLSSPSLSAAS